MWSYPKKKKLIGSSDLKGQTNKNLTCVFNETLIPDFKWFLMLFFYFTQKENLISDLKYFLKLSILLHSKTT